MRGTDRSAITSARGLVLEIGVGSGLTLAAWPGSGSVVGLDISAWRKGSLETVNTPPNGVSRSKMTKIAELIESAASAIIT